MNVSEIKQEILDLLVLNGRKPQTIKSGERVVYLYDALNIVNKEFSKIEQPQLNENQQIVLEWLKKVQADNKDLTVFGILSVFFDEVEHRWLSREANDALNNLSNSEQFDVLQVLSQWAQEQEEDL